MPERVGSRGRQVRTLKLNSGFSGVKSMNQSRLGLAVAVGLAISACYLFAGNPDPRSTSAAISPTDLRTRLGIYADDSMLGRGAGTIGNQRATQYIANEFRKLQLEPAGDSGTFFQDIKPAPTARFDVTKAPPHSARNVIAILRGSDPKLRNTFVAIGAHNDAIGLVSPEDADSVRTVNIGINRRKNELARSVTASERDSIIVAITNAWTVRVPRIDSIVNGADDDGSGTVGLLEIAEAFAKSGVRPRRSILFVSHTGEEKGLLGSRWFTDHPTVELDSIIAQINIDMIGRGGAEDISGGGPNYLQLIGARRLSTELGNLIDQVNSARSQPFKFDYTWDANGHPEKIYCRSDHANYARFGIPVAFFWTGLHADYHQVTDEIQFIDFEHMARIAGFLHDVLQRVANLDHRLRLDKPKTDPTERCVQ